MKKEKKYRVYVTVKIDEVVDIVSSTNKFTEKFQDEVYDLLTKKYPTFTQMKIEEVTET